MTHTPKISVHSQRPNKHHSRHKPGQAHQGRSQRKYPNLQESEGKKLLKTEPSKYFKNRQGYQLVDQKITIRGKNCPVNLPPMCRYREPEAKRRKNFNNRVWQSCCRCGYNEARNAMPPICLIWVISYFESVCGISTMGSPSFRSICYESFKFSIFTNVRLSCLASPKHAQSISNYASTNAAFLSYSAW